MVFLSKFTASVAAFSRGVHRTMSVAATPALPTFSTLLLSHVADGVVEVKLNRGDKSNAMNRAMWQEIGDAFKFLATPDAPCRAVLLTGAGKNFTSGLDLMDHIGLFTAGSGDESANDASRRALRLREVIRSYQASLSSIEACPKPVIAAIHGACIGGGVDMITAADVRFASTDAWFSIKEAEIGLAADVGTLQRLPKIVGNDSIVRELAFTARRFTADEAHKYGILSQVAVDKEALMAHALATARRIASLSPIAVQGTKINLNYARGRSVAEGLEYTAVWNMAMLQTPDIPRAAEAMMGGKTAVFPKL